MRRVYYTLLQFGVYMQKLCFSVPVVPPQNVTAVSTTSTSIFITWDVVPSNQRNGNILGYKVNYTLKGKLHDRKSKEASVTMAYVNLTGLRKNRKFSITVFAFNECGDGPRSDILDVKTDEDSKCFLSNRKHLPSFYRVIET